MAIVDTKWIKRATALSFVLLILLAQLWFVLFLTATEYPKWLVSSTRLLALFSLSLGIVQLLQSFWLKVKGPDSDA